MSNQAFKRLRRSLGMEVSRKPVDSFAWPGGYPLYYLTADGACLCPACVNKEIDRVDEDLRFYRANNRMTGQFAVIGVDANYESLLYCDHCSKQIEAAHGVYDERTAIADCGHAGQTGYVFKAGDRVALEPAENQPAPGYFVKSIASGESIFIPADELGDFVSE